MSDLFSGRPAAGKMGTCNKPVWPSSRVTATKAAERGHRPLLRRVVMPGLGALAALLLMALSAQGALACARDNVPSVSINGRLAVLSHISGRVIPATWTPFVFSQSVLRGRTVTLAEDNREVARALPHSVFSHPWRWIFGDGSTDAFGTRVSHAYRSAGSYRIQVQAYYAVYGAWQTFDLVTIHVR